MLALVPTALFAILYRVTRRPLTAVGAGAWLLYTFYEYAMHRRWLCTGECNIRVDLLLIYPVLIAMTVSACVAGIRALLRRARPPGTDGGEA